MARFVPTLTRYVNIVILGTFMAGATGFAHEGAVALDPPPFKLPAFDQRLGVVGRSYPVGAQLQYTLGKSVQLWGDSQNFKYGYVRFATNVATSVVVSRVGLEAQFFPISILGLSAGYDWGGRWFKPNFADCNAVDCMGRVDRAYLRGQLLAAYRGAIFSGNFRYEELRHIGDRPVFFDEVTLLTARSEKEKVMLYNPTVLYTLSPEYNIGFTSVLVRGMTSGNTSHLFGPLVQRIFDRKTQLILGAGRNHSNVVHPSFSLFLMFTYTIDPSLAIIDLAQRK